MRERPGIERPFQPISSDSLRELTVRATFAALMLATMQASSADPANPALFISTDELRASGACNEVSEVTAYVNVSRHGSALSDTIGAWRNSVLLSIDRDSTSDGVEQLRRYMRDPRAHLNGYFKATFRGLVQCDKSGKPDRLVAQSAEGILQSEYVSPPPTRR